MDTTVLPEKTLLKHNRRLAQAAAHFRWLVTLVLAPHRGFTALVESRQAGWFFPFGFLITSGLLFSAVTAWTALQPDSPPDFMLYVLGALVRTVLVWLGWLWVSGILRSAFILAGMRCAENQLRSLVAWAAVPFILRDLVRTGYVLASQAPIQCPGLSGLLCASTQPFDLLMGQLLAQFDIYLFWHAALLWLGLQKLLDGTTFHHLGGRLFTAVSLALVSALLLKGVVGALVAFLNVPAVQQLL